MPKKRQISSRQTPNALQAAQLEERNRMEERMLDKRHGKPREAAVGNGSMRVLVRMPSPSKAADLRAEDSLEPLSCNDTKRLARDMSRSLWSSLNPGYVQQEPGTLCSVASADYVWNDKEVDDIKRFDTVGDKFHRRWDQQSHYNEAAAVHRQVMKRPKEQTSGAVKA